MSSLTEEEAISTASERLLQFSYLGTKARFFKLFWRFYSDNFKIRLDKPNKLRLQ